MAQAGEVLSLFQSPASGREAEVAVLVSEYEEAQARGRAQVVFVRGPAGVGKSHLVAALGDTLRRRGVTVFEGGSGRDARRPFGLFAPLGNAVLAALGHGGVPQEKVATLARSLQALSRRAPAQGDRLQLFEAVAEAFVLAGRATPAFVFPDLEVADQGSLELLKYLLAVVGTPGAQAGGLYVLSFRDEGALPKAVAELVARVSARTVALKGLDLEGIRSFLARREVAQSLLEATGGNPEAMGALLQAPHTSVVDLFSRRLSRLDAAQGPLLDALALAPDALALEALEATLSELGEGGEVAARLDALVAAHLVQAKVVLGQPLYRFVREAEASAHARALSAERRRSVQLALGHALQRLGADEAAAGLLLSVAPLEGAPLAVAAAQALAERGAYEEAIALWLRALPLLKGAARGAVAQKAGALLVATCEYRRGARLLLEGGRLGAGAARPRAALEAAKAVAKLGRYALATLALQPALGQAATQAEAGALAAELALLRGRPDEALSAGRLLLQRLDDEHPVAVAVRQVMGKALLVKGEAAAAQALFARNVASAQGAGLAQQAAAALLNVGVAAQKQGLTEAALEAYAQVPSTFKVEWGAALANAGMLRAEAGELELALAQLGQALKVLSRLESRREVAHVASNLARLHLFLGDFERAAELTEHVQALAGTLQEPYLAASATLNLGALQLDSRRPLEAARSFDGARVAFEGLGNDGYAALAAALKARAHLAAGERAQASAELSRRCLEKGAGQLPAAVVEAELARGELFLALGDLHGASRSAARAKDALVAAPELEGPYRVYFLMGQLKAAGGDLVGSQAEYARAGRALEALVQKVPAVFRSAFLSVPRRAEVLAVSEPELKLPRPLASLVSPGVSTYGLVGRSPALQRLTRQLEPIGRSNATALIRGESGTGKELLAEALHNLSSRRNMPLVKVNCGAMVEELLLSELFGHEKGAFTGAVRERKGRFELADGGTLFLDEIGDISPKAQVALLRVLQEREFERVGGTKTLKVDVRVLCATNRDLEALIAQGRFRADLYYRLKGVMLELPPLRERPEDLPLLANFFLTRVAKERGEVTKQLSAEALELLGKHSWPGNVRELENVLSSGAIFADGQVIGTEAFLHVSELRALVQGLPVPVAAPMAAAAAPQASPLAAPAPAAVAGPPDLYELVRNSDLGLRELQHALEMASIKRALLEAKGNISEAARLLKMKRSRLSQIVNGEEELKGVAHADE